jgi:hypothetical protein
MDVANDPPLPQGGRGQESANEVSAFAGEGAAAAPVIAAPPIEVASIPSALPEIAVPPNLSLAPAVPAIVAAPAPMPEVIPAPAPEIVPEPAAEPEPAIPAESPLPLLGETTPQIEPQTVSLPPMPPVEAQDLLAQMPSPADIAATTPAVGALTDALSSAFDAPADKAVAPAETPSLAPPMPAYADITNLAPALDSPLPQGGRGQESASTASAFLGEGASAPAPAETPKVPADAASAAQSLADALASAFDVPAGTPAPAAPPVTIANLAPPITYPEIVAAPVTAAPIIEMPQPAPVAPVAPPAPPVEVASALPPSTPLPEIASAVPPAPVPQTASLLPPATPAPSSPQYATQKPAVADAGKHDWWTELPAGSSIRVSNGAGRTKMAARFAYYLSDHGLSVGRVANAPSFNYRQTIIFYNPDQKDFAYKLGGYFPFPVKYGVASKGHGQVEVILGSDILDFDDHLKP